jgi:pyruvate,orthophosphate dikinase
MTQYVYFFGKDQTEGDPQRRDLLGGKGAGLAEMTSLGLPVPEGFTITTEACAAFQKEGALPRAIEAEIEKAMAKLEKATGKRFGDSEAPLLVSVRSGARASMPGMMDTILNLGLTPAAVEGLATQSKDRRFALDAYRRFITMFADVAMGLDREDFDHALDAARTTVAKARNLPLDRWNSEELKRNVPDSELGVAELEALVETYRGIVQKGSGRPFPDEPKEQLTLAIAAVFRSWQNQRAIVYRRMHDIPDAWGTACNIQSMVFGNWGDTSATGVAFTRNPSTGEKKLFGEYLPNAQGEDVVAGIRTPMPLLAGEDSLEKTMPAAFAELVGIAERLESHFRDMQDLEFTIERGTLYMLQCRSGKRTAKAAVRIATELVAAGIIDQDTAVLRVEAEALDQLLHPTLDPKAPKILLAKGLPASPGAAQGHVVFDADEAHLWNSQGRAVILVRTETSPEDILGMKAARGILTARGGMTSHAAVVARGMGKPCVAGTSSISVDYRTETMSVSITTEVDGARKVENRTFKKGDLLTLDGGTGSVYEGAIPTVPAETEGELGKLLEWADRIRTMKVRANADTPTDATTARAFGAEGIGLCRTEHMFFDESRIRAVREMILAGDLDGRVKAIAKLLPEQRKDFDAIFEAMAGLPVTIRLLDPPLHEFLPNTPEQIQELAGIMNVSVDRLKARVSDLHEFNPMLGHRGVRLGITYPEIYEMQIRAILEAARDVAARGIEVKPEIMIPLAITRAELAVMRAMVDTLRAEIAAPATLFGTMIELPRAALCADELAEVSEFFSFGTNDLTQATLGLSRDDAGKFLPAYLDAQLLPKDPFVSIDQRGVGQLVLRAVELGKKIRPEIKLGVCGEHGGDPTSIDFFHRAGLAYVSCSPFRVPIARLAAAQAVLRAKAGAVGNLH